MLEPGRSPRPNTHEVLAGCLEDVSIARDRLRAARGVGMRQSDQSPLRADLLAALEGYAEAISRLGAPVPHQVRAEIDLYRRLQGG